VIPTSKTLQSYTRFVVMMFSDYIASNIFPCKDFANVTQNETILACGKEAVFW